MLSILRLFKKLDILGTPIQFKHEGNEKFKSVLGSILSLIIILLTFSLAVSQGSILINRSNPMTSLSNSISTRNTINLTSKFPIVFYLTNVRQQPIINQDKLVQILATTIKFRNNTQTIKNYPVMKCTFDLIKNNFGNYSELFLQNLNPYYLENNYYYCFLPQNNSFLIDNILGGDPGESFVATLTYCNNATTNGTCLAKNDITNLMENSFFQIFTVDYFFDHKNFTSPGIPYINIKSLQISTSLFKKYYLIYKYIEYFTDTGLVFFEQSMKNYYQLNFIDRDFVLNANAALVPNTISIFVFTMYQNNYDVYYRSYLTIPEILANLGGAFNTLFLMGSLVNYYLEKRLKEIEIFEICNNENFIKFKNGNSIKRSINSINKNKNQDFEEKSFECKKIDLSKSNLENDNKLTLNNKFKDIESEIQKIEIKMDLKSSFDKNSQQITMKYNSIIFEKQLDLENVLLVNISPINYYFSCCRNKNQLLKFNLAEEFTNQIFDIVFIFGSLLEMQLLNRIKYYNLKLT